ncbi:MAG: hypothetical protein PHV37_10255 [Candidatus Gastranaerophilales bacterium]|nr:hypothetical protein [Candidatus Gastranaerophilales bacterium]
MLKTNRVQNNEQVKLAKTGEDASSQKSLKKTSCPVNVKSVYDKNGLSQAYMAMCLPNVNFHKS